MGLQPPTVIIKTHGNEQSHDENQIEFQHRLVTFPIPITRSSNAQAFSEQIAFSLVTVSLLMQSQDSTQSAHCFDRRRICLNLILSKPANLRTVFISRWNTSKMPRHTPCSTCTVKSETDDKQAAIHRDPDRCIEGETMAIKDFVSISSFLKPAISQRLTFTFAFAFALIFAILSIGCASQLPSDATAASLSSASSASIQISSPATSVTSGSTLQLSASGGRAPYIYSISASTDSTVNATTGLFTAGSMSGAVVVLTTDAVGNIGFTSISVVGSFVGSAASTTTSVTLAQGNFRLAAGSSQKLADDSNLKMQSDGNLIFYNNSGSAVWSSGTGNMNCASCYVTFQNDGNLVLYINNISYWNSGTSGSKFMISETAPYVTIMDNSGSTLWSGYSASGRMANLQFSAGSFTMAGSQQIPVNGGNLTLRTDGNLVLYSTGGAAYYSSNTGGRSCGTGCEIDFQSDGNLVMYQNGTSYWSSNTAGTGSHLQIANTSPFLRILNSAGSVIWTN